MAAEKFGWLIEAILSDPKEVERRSPLELADILQEDVEFARNFAHQRDKTTVVTYQVPSALVHIPFENGVFHAHDVEHVQQLVRYAHDKDLKVRVILWRNALRVLSDGWAA
jgi:hypothetical protein